MWFVWLNFRGNLVQMPGKWKQRDEAEWQVAEWKQEVNMTGDPFRYVWVSEDGQVDKTTLEQRR
jgi:hypothetical protein